MSKTSSSLRTRPAAFSNSGFTLVELLVVIAIIGVLVALLLPAVQAAREASRRSACQNNLKQLGLALPLYEDAKGEYPAGAIWGNGPDNHRGSLMIFLLPYIEQQTIYDLFDFSQNTDEQINPHTMQPIGEIPIEVYKCPSDEHPDDNNHDRAMSNYAGLKGSSKHINNSGCSCRTFNTWNSFALSPYESFATAIDYAGVFTRIGIVTRREHITDGLSQTAFIGEVRPECGAHASNGWAMSNNGQGLTSTIVPINYDSCLRERARDGLHPPLQLEYRTGGQIGPSRWCLLAVRRWVGPLLERIDRHVDLPIHRLES